MSSSRPSAPRQSRLWAIPCDERIQLRRLRRVRALARRRPGRVRLFGVDFEYVDGPSLYSQYKEIFVRGAYDFHVANPRPEILDCGANLGLATLRFRRHHPRARIRAFEPDADLAAIARKNLTAVGDAATEIVCAAVWSENGTVRFAPQCGDAGRIDPRGAVEVRSVDVAGLCQEPIDLLKLDVEGAEGRILARLVESGAIGRVERMVCEWHEIGPGRSLLHRTLGQLGDAGFLCRLFAGGPSPDVDPDPTRSGLARVPYLGATTLLYAWRPRP